MLHLDLRTIIFTQFLLSILFAILFLVMCRIEGGLRAVRWWGGSAFLLAMVSRLFFLPQDHMSVVARCFAYFCAYGTLACFYRGIVHFLAPTRNPKWIWLAMIATDVALLAFSFPLHRFALTSVVYALGCVLFRGALAYELYRGANGRSFLRWFSVFMWAYAFYALGVIAVDGRIELPAFFGLLGKNAALAFLLGNFVLSTMSYLLFLLFWGEELLAQSGRDAMTDSLTGLLNRRGVEFHLAGVWREAQTNTMPFCVGLIDIDHFKEINDRFGHAVGDEAIRTIVRSISTSIRSSDYIGRLGGDEILVVFPLTGVDEALSIAQRIRDRVNTRKEEPSVSVSIGLTEWRVAEPVDDTIQRADIALYGSKREGRNRVTVER